MKANLYLIILSMLLFQCTKEEITDKTSFKVAGYIYSAGKPVANASVELDSTNLYQTQTDDEGYFEIENVPTGDYMLKAHKYEPDGSFSEIESEVEVKDDIFINTLKLPVPINIFNPYDVNSTSMRLKWNKTDAEDFREYKLYRHTSSGLDETTGTLVHVSTSINDTSFIDEGLIPNTKYFYRVYVMNEYGRLGGSNIVDSITEIYNYIQNGDFEDITNLFWLDNSSCKTIEFTEEEKKNGNRSLHIVRDTITAFNGSVLKTIGTNIPFQKGKTYKLSGWMMHRGKKHNGMMAYVVITGVAVHLSTNCMAGIDIGSFIQDQNQTDVWIYSETFFQCNEDYFTYKIQIGTLYEEAWFDDLKIESIN